MFGLYSTPVYLLFMFNIFYCRRYLNISLSKIVLTFSAKHILRSGVWIYILKLHFLWSITSCVIQSARWYFTICYI